jgi:uncharacterized membrane protein
MANSTSTKVLMASAVAGLLALGATGTAQADEAAGKDSKVKCYGVNKCKGTGACGGPGYSCAGNNACKGQGWLYIDKDTCLKIQGGRLTPEEEKS